MCTSGAHQSHLACKPLPAAANSGLSQFDCPSRCPPPTHKLFGPSSPPETFSFSYCHSSLLPRELASFSSCQSAPREIAIAALDFPLRPWASLSLTSIIKAFLTCVAHGSVISVASGILAYAVQLLSFFSP